MDSPILSQPIKFVPEYRAIIMKRLLFIFTFFFASLPFMEAHRIF